MGALDDTPRSEVMMVSLTALSGHRQSPWVDYLSRPMIDTGRLASLAEAGITGVTSNPTTFKKAIADDDAYDHLLRDAPGDAKEAFLGLAQQDVRRACDLLRPTFDQLGGGCDGWVSLEVDPRLARDTDGTVEEAERLWALIDRPNLMVKIPGTVQGLPAVEEAISRGIPVNVTLLFSLRRHREAAEAYLRGLSRLRQRGGDPGRVASVASFFVSRVDAEADDRLPQGSADLAGTLAVANAKLAYQTYREVFAGPDWQEMAAAGAHPQQCLWASTGTKDPAMRDVAYVERLIGPDTVTTMPPDTIDAFRDHGEAARTLDADVDGARATLRRFADAGVDYDDLVATLEQRGIEQFAESFRGLLDGVERRRAALVSGGA